MNQGTHQFVLRIPYELWRQLVEHCSKGNITAWIIQAIREKLEPALHFGYELEVMLVLDGANLLGLEFRRGDEFWFVSTRQDLWPGVRVGRFPRNEQGKDFERRITTFEMGGNARIDYGDARPPYTSPKDQ